MARDKGKDDKFFNCGQQSEHDYVASLYALAQRPQVRTLLQNGCSNGTIRYSTHMQVYQLIQRSLGFPIPI